MRIVRGETWADIDRLEVEVEAGDVGKHFLATATKEGDGQEAHPALNIEELGLDMPGIAGPEARSLVDPPGTTQPYACAWCGRGAPDSLAYYYIGGSPKKILLCRPGYGCANQKRWGH